MATVDNTELSRKQSENKRLNSDFEKGISLNKTHLAKAKANAKKFTTGKDQGIFSENNTKSAYKSILGSTNKSWDQNTKDSKIENKGFSQGALSSNRTLTDDDLSESEAAGSTVVSTASTQKGLMKAQMRGITDTLTKIHQRAEMINSKFAKASLQASQGLLKEAEKANNFRMTVQAGYYKSSIEYKKQILSELQQINRNLALGFNIQDGKKDTTKEVESFARVMLGEDFKKGLKGGFIKAFKAGTAGGIFDVSNLDLVKSLVTGVVDKMKNEGVFKTIATEGMRTGGKFLFGEKNMQKLDTAMSDPGTILEALASRGQYSKNAIIKALGKGFGKDKSSLASFDIGQFYEKNTKNFKDRSSFDKAAHQALTKVIPYQLSKLVAAATGKKAMFWNAASGKFETQEDSVKKLKTNFSSDKFDKSFKEAGDRFMRVIDTYDTSGDGQTIASEIMDILKNDKEKQRKFFEGIALFFKEIASSGEENILEFITFNTINVQLIEDVVGKGKLEPALMAMIANVLDRLKKTENREIGGELEEMISIAEDFQKEWRADQERLKDHILGSSAIIGVYGEDHMEDASESAKRLKKIADKKADKNAKKVQKALETWNATSIMDIKYSSSDILSRDRQRLQEKKIEFTDAEMSSIAELAMANQDPLLAQVAGSTIWRLESRLAELEANGETESITYKTIQKALEKAKALDGYQKLMDKKGGWDENDVQKLIKNNYKGSNIFGGAKLNSLDPKDIKDFATTFFNSDAGDKVGKVASFGASAGIFTLLAKKGGASGLSAPLLGAMAAGALKISGKLDGVVRTISTHAGDEKVDDGTDRTKREVIMQNLMRDMLPAGFATVTGVKVSSYIKNNMRFGNILGPIMGFAIGSGIYGLSKMGFVKKLIGGLFTPLKWLAKGIDKVAFKGAIGKTLAPVGEFIRNKLGMNQPRHKTSDLIKNANENARKQRDKTPASSTTTSDKPTYGDQSSLANGRDDQALISAINQMEWAEVSQYNENDATWSNSVRRAIKLRKAELRKAGKDQVSGGASSGTLTISRGRGGGGGLLGNFKFSSASTQVGDCAPKVLAKIHQLFWNTNTPISTFEELASKYVAKNGKELTIRFFYEALGNTNTKISKFKKNFVDLSEMDKAIKSDMALIAQISLKEEGHFVLFYRKGKDIIKYDPLKGNQEIKSSVSEILFCNEVIIVQKLSSKGKIATETIKDASTSLDSDSSTSRSINTEVPTFKRDKKSLFKSTQKVGKDTGNIIDVNIIGGHLDTVGVIGAIDAESYKSRIKESLKNPISKSKLATKLQNWNKEFFKRDNKARDIGKEQDLQEEREAQNTEALQKLANEDKKPDKEKDKKGGLLGMLGKIAPWLIGGMATLLLSSHKVKDMLKFAWRGLQSIMKKLNLGGLLKKMWGGAKKLFGFGGNAAEKTAAETASKFGSEALEEGAELAVKGGTKAGEELLEEGAETAVKNSGKLAKTLGKIGEALTKLGEKLAQLPVIGGLCKKISGSKVVQWFMEKLPKVANKVASEGAEEAVESGGKKLGKKLLGGIKGTLSGFIGVGTVINMGFALWDIVSAIKDIPKTFKMEDKPKVTWKHKLSAGLVAGLLSLVEAMVPGAGWVLIPVRILAEGFLIRAFYNHFFGKGEESDDEDGVADAKGEEAQELDEDGNPVNSSSTSNGTSTATKDVSEEEKAKKQKMLEGLMDKGGIFGGQFGSWATGDYKNLSNFSDQMNNHLSKGQQGTPTPGGQGSGDLSRSGNNNYGGIRFYSQASFLGNHSMGGSNVKDSGCALAVAKMILSFLGRNVDDMALYKSVNQYRLKDNSVSMGFFSTFLGGQLTSQLRDLIGAINYKGAAASVLVRKGRGYHFIALLNYNGKILYGDPEAGNFEDITNNMGLLGGFIQAAVFNSPFIMTNMTNIARVGGKGFLSGLINGAKNIGSKIWGGIKSVGASIGKAIGFGNQAVGGVNLSSGNEGTGNQGSETRTGGFNTYEGSAYEFTPGYMMPNVAGANQGVTGDMQGYQANSPIERIMSNITMGEFDVANPKDPKVLGRSSPDTGGSQSYGIWGINTRRGNSWWDFIKTHLGQSGDPYLIQNANSPNTSEYQRRWKAFAEANPEKMFAMQYDWGWRNYFKPMGVSGSSNLGQQLSAWMNPKLANDMGVQMMVFDLATQRGPGGAKKALLAAGAANMTDPRAFIETVTANELRDAPRNFGNTPSQLRGVMTNRIPGRKARSMSYVGQAGGFSGLTPLDRSYIVSTNWISSKSPNWKAERACGPASAYTLHKIFIGKDNPVRTESFLRLADQYAEKGSGWVNASYFERFGGEKVVMTGKEMMDNITSNAYMGRAVVFLRGAHYVIIANRGNMLYYIDTHGERGNGSIETLNAELKRELSTSQEATCIFFKSFLHIENAINNNSYKATKVEANILQSGGAPANNTSTSSNGISSTVGSAMKNTFSNFNNQVNNTVANATIAGQNSTGGNIEPAWILIGKKEIGSTDRNKYLAVVNMRDTQWCAAFVMWCFKQAGINFPYSASSQAPVNDSSNWEKLSSPVYGCVGVWKNTNETKRKEGGHMGFYLGMNGTAASILSGNPKVDIKDYGIPKTRQGKEFVGWYVPKAAKGQMGNYQALGDHVAPNGDLGVNGVDSSIKMKNGSIGGFMDSSGNFIDLEKGIKSYQQNLWNYKHPREASINAALANSVGNAGSTAAISGTVGALGLSQANDMVSGLPIENGKPNVSADSPAVKAANYAWDHPFGGKSACGAAVGTALDKFFKTKMKTPRHASTWFGAKILTIEKGKEGSPDAANAQMANVSNMQANGFKMISVASTPQIGDVLCYNDPARPWWYGHVCMLSYKGWVSYYQQKSFFCYSSSDPSKAKFTLWRYNDGAGGGEDDGIDPSINTGNDSMNQAILAKYKKMQGNTTLSTTSWNNSSNTATYNLPHSKIVANTKATDLLRMPRSGATPNTPDSIFKGTGNEFDKLQYTELQRLNANIEKLVGNSNIANKLDKAQLESLKDIAKTNETISKKENQIGHFVSGKTEDGQNKEEFKRLEETYKSWTKDVVQLTNDGKSFD